MVQVALTGIEVMLIFATVVASVVFLNDFGLLIEELALLCLVLILFLGVELATADEPAPDSLDLKCGPLFIVKLPLNFEHSPVLLNYNCCGVLFVPIFLCFIQSLVIGVYHVAVTSFSLF